MNQRVKDVMKFAFFLGLGLFLVWWSWSSFSEEDRIKVWQSFKEANYYWVGFSLVAALLSHVSRAMRWQMFLQPIAHKPTFGNAFCAVMINYLANLAFPRLGEITRCGVINQYEKIPVDKAFGTVITERIIDVVTLVILTAIVVLTQFETIGTYFLENIAAPMQEKYGHLLSGDNLILFAIVGFGLLVLAGVAWFLLRNFRETALYQKIMGVVKGIYEGVMSVRKVQNIPIFIAHSIFIWVMYFTMVYICFQALPETQHLTIDVGLSILVFGTFGFIATQGGVGSYPIIVAGTLVIYGVVYETGYAFGWIVWTAQTLLMIVLGFLALVALPILNRK